MISNLILLRHSASPTVGFQTKSFTALVSWYLAHVCGDTLLERCHGYRVQEVRCTGGCRYAGIV